MKILSLLIYFSFAQLAQAEVLEIAVGEWSPLVSAKSEGYGVIPQRLAKVFKAMDIDVSYKFFPWSRVFKQVETGHFLLSIGWIKNSEREKRVQFSKKPIFQTETALFYLKNRSLKFESFKDLIGLKIGITRDYAQGAEFAKAIEKYELQVEVASSDELNMKKLLSNRIDVFPIDRSVGHKLIEQLFVPVERSFIVDHPKPVAKESLWLIATKDNAKATAILREFDKYWKP